MFDRDDRTRACPTWCSTFHEDVEPEGQVRHTSEQRLVPVVMKGYSDASDAPSASSLVIVTTRRSGELEPWVFIGEAHRKNQHLHLSLESAQRLAGELARHLGALSR